MHPCVLCFRQEDSGAAIPDLSFGDLDKAMNRAQVPKQAVAQAEATSEVGFSEVHMTKGNQQKITHYLTESKLKLSSPKHCYLLPVQRSIHEVHGKRSSEKWETSIPAPGPL